MTEFMLAHSEYMDVLDSGSALGPEVVTVIDPAGWIVLGIILVLIAIIMYQFDKLKDKDDQIDDLNRIVSYYYYEDQNK